MPLLMLKKIGTLEMKPIRMSLHLVNQSITYPLGVMEDVLVKVGELTFPVDFVIMDIEEDREVPIILGKPIIMISKVIVDIGVGCLQPKLEDQVMNFNIFEAMQHPSDHK